MHSLGRGMPPCMHRIGTEDYPFTGQEASKGFQDRWPIGGVCNFCIPGCSFVASALQIALTSLAFCSRSPGGAGQIFVNSRNTVRNTKDWGFLSTRSANRVSYAPNLGS